MDVDDSKAKKHFLDSLSADESKDPMQGIREMRDVAHDESLKAEQLRQYSDIYRVRLKEFQRLRELVVGWLYAVMIIIFIGAIFGHTGSVRTAEFLGVKVEQKTLPIFQISEGVLIALVTTTSVSVIGLFATATKWLFPAPPAVLKDGGEKSDKSDR